MNETSLAKRIKLIKNQNNLTNEDLARLSGLPISNISKLLSGSVKSPTIDTVKKIADALNISIDYLVYGNMTSGHRICSRDEFQLIENFRSLNDSGRKEIIKYEALLIASKLYIDSKHSEPL